VGIWTLCTECRQRPLWGCDPEATEHVGPSGIPRMIDSAISEGSSGRWAGEVCLAPRFLALAVGGGRALDAMRTLNLHVRLAEGTEVGVKPGTRTCLSPWRRMPGQGADVRGPGHHEGGS
jgi:hypothetical protein